MNIKWKLKLYTLKFLLILPDRVFNTIIFIIKLKYIPRFAKPRSFNEKINFIKLYSNYGLREIVADRIKVREYVKEKAANCKLIKLLWNGSDFTEEIYNKLPDKFVIKANHGSGMVKIVDKKKIVYKELLSEILPWLEYDYGRLTRQWVYNNLDKIYIVEECLESEHGDLPDYKFICINGKVQIIQVDTDRFQGHKQNLYDRKFRQIDVQRMDFPNRNFNITEPKLMNNAIEIAEMLSEDFDVIRVDLYILDNEIYFGELTNIPGNGFIPFKPLQFDFAFGEKVTFCKELSSL